MNPIVLDSMEIAILLSMLLLLLQNIVEFIQGLKAYSSDKDYIHVLNVYSIHTVFYNIHIILGGILHDFRLSHYVSF